MKMKKMVGALALTAALAMGTMPAFASGPSATGSSEFDNTEAGSTDIKAEVKKDLNPAIKATVPLQVVVTFGNTGASDIVGPTSDAYKITNTGNGAIKVKDVEVAEMKTPFTSAAIYQSGSNWNTVSPDAQITTGNYLMFTYETAGNKTYLTNGHNLSQAKATGLGAIDGSVVTGAKDFTEETIAVGANLPITFAGKAYFTDTISSSDVSDTLCKVKYTISA